MARPRVSKRRHSPVAMKLGLQCFTGRPSHHYVPSESQLGLPSKARISRWNTALLGGGQAQMKVFPLFFFNFFLSFFSYFSSVSRDIHLLALYYFCIYGCSIGDSSNCN